VSPVDELPVGTVTFLFTDIEGSTRLLKQLRERYGEALGEHQRILRETFAAHDGHEIDTQGDSFFVAFGRAKDAVAAAVDGQRRLAEHEWPDGAELRVRMGLHTGEPAASGERYVGLGVHRAARVSAAGHGGQVLVSQATRELLRDNPLPDVALRDLGEHPLKDLDEPERLYQLVAPGLEATFPPLRTAAPASLESREDELPSALVEFAILGPLEARSSGEPVSLGGPKQRALLAMLLLEAGRVVSLDRLVEALWSGAPPPTAVASLQNFVAQLRKALGPEVIETRPPGYLIRLVSEQLDLARVRSLIDAARASEPMRRAALLDDALAFWRGEPLAEFRYETFAQEEIARLEEFHLTLAEERAEAKLAIGAHAEMVAELEGLVRAHPLRERLRAQLMLALYRSGRQAQALEAYREGRELLVEELGLEPSPLLRGVHASILRQETFAVDRGAIPEVEHFKEVAAAVLAGKVTVVVGSDSEPLASELARRFGVEAPTPELARVSQAVAVLNGAGPLYDTLHTLIEGDGEPSDVHRFLARLPALLRERETAQPLLVTTGYELALERALEEVKEPYETVCYLAAGPMRGSFCHIAPTGVANVIDRPNAYTSELALDERTVLLHLQGRIDRSTERAWESFAVTEDDFIHYGDVAGRLPVSLAARLRRTHLLLLGYTLSTWTLRVVLERLWGSEPLPYRSWSVYPGPQPLEREFWRKRDVEVVDMAPAAYVVELERELEKAGAP
jgi:class 3 adenylate cyclase/DNA-binding SARP family transcriptional activator